MAVTPASLLVAYPEWVQANTAHPGMVLTAIAQGETMVDEAVVGARYDEAVMLAAGSWLYDHPYGRDMREPNDASENPYEKRLEKILARKGSAWRTLWDISDFGGT